MLISILWDEKNKETENKTQTTKNQEEELQLIKVDFKLIFCDAVLMFVPLFLFLIFIRFWSLLWEIDKKLPTRAQFIKFFLISFLIHSHFIVFYYNKMLPQTVSSFFVLVFCFYCFAVFFVFFFIIMRVL